MTHKEVLQQVYETALDEVAKQDSSTSLDDKTAE